VLIRVKCCWVERAFNSAIVIAVFNYFVVVSYLNYLLINFQFDYVDFDNHIKIHYSAPLNDLVYSAIDLNMNYPPVMMYLADMNKYY